MVRDFIVVDSSKAKEVLKSALDMNDGDFSGNKLGLSSKIIPVVSLNNVPKMQVPVDYAFAIAQNVWYNVFNEKGALRIIGINIWHDTDAEDLEFQLIIDGLTFTGGISGAVAGTVYTIYLGNQSAGQTLNTQATEWYFIPFMVEGNDIQFWIRKTSAVGANHQHAKVVWQKW